MTKNGIYLLLMIFVPFMAMSASVPSIINYQGNVEVQDQPYSGVGYFKFAIVDDSTQSLWSNDGTSVGGSEPTASVALNVHAGLFSVRLGDDSLPNMAVIPKSVFDGSGLRLRIWFSTDNVTFERLSDGGADQPLVSVPYSIRAGRASYVGNAPDPVNGDPGTAQANLLPRESVWPEHYGRGNTIKSYYINARVTSNQQYDVFINYPDHMLPSNKVFVVTDVSFWGTGEFRIRTKNNIDDIGGIDDLVENLFIGNGDNTTQIFSFKGGLPIAQNKRLQLRTLETGHCTISGFEYSSEYVPPNITQLDPFFDDFNDNELLSPPWITTSSGSSTFIGGGIYRLNRGTSIRTSNAGGFKNCRVEVLTAGGTGTDSPAFSLYCRLSRDLQNSYMVNFESGVITLNSIRNGVVTSIYWNENTLIPIIGTYTYKVEIQGNSLSAVQLSGGTPLRTLNYEVTNPEHQINDKGETKIEFYCGGSGDIGIYLDTFTFEELP